MKISTMELLDELRDRTQQHLRYSEALLLTSENELNSRMSEDSWSVLECLEHLNRYGDFYIPEITNRMKISKSSPQPTFKPGILGNYFAMSMLPKERLNRMKTIKAMNPLGSDLNKDVVREFIKQQQQFLELLEKARNINLEKTKTGISISRWVTLKLGDTFRFVTYHNARHIAQAERVLRNL